MKIAVERDVFAEQIGWILRCVSSRAALPVLGGVLVEAGRGGVRLAGTDLEIVGDLEMEGRVDQEGRAVLPGRVLGEIARNLPQGTVTVEAEGAEARIVCGSAEFTLRLLAAEDLPALQFAEGGAGGTVEGPVFAVAAGQVARAASVDEARPVLTGVLVEAEADKLTLAATDSYRLAVRELAWKGPAEPVRRVVPARALQEAARGAEGAERVEIALGEAQAVFSRPGRRLGTRLIEGEFPNWRQLVPSELPNELRIEREAFTDAVRRVGILAQQGAPVRVDLGSDGAQLSAGSQEVGQASERVEGKYEGEPVTIAFNPQYLVDGMQGIEGDEVVLAVRDGLKPAVVRGADEAGFLYLVMPVRLGS